MGHAVVNGVIYKNLNYDLLNDLMPIARLPSNPLLVVTSNQVPAPMTELVHLARRGDLAAARACLSRLLPLMDANFLETNPSPVKAGLAAMGKIMDVLRLPLVPVTQPTRDALRAALQAAGIHVR